MHEYRSNPTPGRRDDGDWDLKISTECPNEQLIITRAARRLLKPVAYWFTAHVALSPKKTKRSLTDWLQGYRTCVWKPKEIHLPCRDGFDGAFVAKLFKTRDPG